jgi:hypothetical protein
MYTQTAYRCSYCHKYGLSKSWIKKHEEKCFKNPATRSCTTCANLKREKIEDYSAFDHLYETYPVCLSGINLENPLFYENEYRSSRYISSRYILKTACKHWEERPEDEEELIIHQDNKERILGTKKSADNKPEMPF